MKANDATVNAVMNALFPDGKPVGNDPKTSTIKDLEVTEWDVLSVVPDPGKVGMQPAELETYFRKANLYPHTLPDVLEKLTNDGLITKQVIPYKAEVREYYSIAPEAITLMKIPFKTMN